LVAVNKMDLVDFAVRRVFQAHRGNDYLASSPLKLTVQDHDLHPDLGVDGGQHRQQERADALVSRADAAAPSRACQCRRRAQPGRLPLSRADGHSPPSGFPRLCRHRGLGHHCAGRRDQRAAVGQAEHRVKSIVTYDGELAKRRPATL
jgi:hypothetical protein